MIEHMSIHNMVTAGDAAAISAGKWPEQLLNARDENGLTPLMLAAQKGDYYCTQALKEAGADTDLTDKEGRKAVDIAAKHGHSLVLLALIKGGCGG